MPLGVVIALVLLMRVGGCGAPPVQEQARVTGLTPPLPEAAQLDALAWQEGRQYREALGYWQDAEQVVRERIEVLARQLEKISSEHSARGIRYYKEKNGDAAFREFMTALRLDPGNTVAVSYLQKRYSPARTTKYTVQKGDTFASIAAKAYGSSEYAFALPLFSSVRDESRLVAGKEITMADLDSFSSAAIKSYGADIELARSLFKSGDYEGVLPVAEALREKHPEDEEASYIINMSLLKIALMRQDQGRYDEAVNTLLRVDPRFTNVESQLARIQEKRESKITTDTREANSRLLQKGTERSAAGSYLEALDILLLVDPGFPGRETAVAHVRSKLRSQADHHYKEGVMLFVEEDLDGAIAEWQKALQCDPNNLDALQSIEKARKLQQKVKTID